MENENETAKLGKYKRGPVKIYCCFTHNLMTTVYKLTISMKMERRED